MTCDNYLIILPINKMKRMEIIKGLPFLPLCWIKSFPGSFSHMFLYESQVPLLCNQRLWKGTLDLIISSDSTLPPNFSEDLFSWIQSSQQKRSFLFWVLLEADSSSFWSQKFISPKRKPALSSKILHLYCSALLLLIPIYFQVLFQHFSW